MTFSDTRHALRAALDGFGIAFMPDDMLAAHVGSRRFVRLLEDWCPSFPGHHLHHSSRRKPSHAFEMVVDALRA